MVVSSARLGPESDCSGKDPEAIVQVNYRPTLSLERVLNIKTTIFRQKREI
jgi:hypothetical protein